jgi:hypothetical protein
VDPISQDNIRRLFDQDPDKAMENDGFLKMLKENEGNVEAQQEFLRSSDGKGASVHVEQMVEVGAA